MKEPDGHTGTFEIIAEFSDYMPAETEPTHDSQRPSTSGGSVEIVIGQEFSDTAGAKRKPPQRKNSRKSSGRKRRQ